MMIFWVTRAALILLILTLVYLGLRISGRAYLRRRVAAEIALLSEGHADGVESRDLDVEFDIRYAERDRASRRRLIVLIYGFPVAVIALLVWLAEIS